jgi:hypothetical protein
VFHLAASIVVQFCHVFVYGRTQINPQRHGCSEELKSLKTDLKKLRKDTEQLLRLQTANMSTTIHR